MRREYLTLQHGRRIDDWRKIYTPRPWWKRAWQKTMEALDRAFWP